MLKMKINAGSYAKNKSESEGNELLSLIRELYSLECYIEIVDFELFVIPNRWATSYQLDLLGLMAYCPDFPEKKATFFMKLDLEKLRQNTNVDIQMLMDEIAKSKIDIELSTPLVNKHMESSEDFMIQDDLERFLKTYIGISKANC